LVHLSPGLLNCLDQTADRWRHPVLARIGETQDEAALSIDAGVV